MGWIRQDPRALLCEQPMLTLPGGARPVRVSL
jgi:hypothetical protein